MGVSEINELRSAMMRALAADLELPVDLLPEPEPLVDGETLLCLAEREALEHAARLQEGLDRIADEIGPDLIRSFGLDPERYRLRWVSVPFDLETPPC
jgi:hypothetical protein